MTEIEVEQSVKQAIADALRGCETVMRSRMYSDKEKIGEFVTQLRRALPQNRIHPNAKSSADDDNRDIVNKLLNPINWLEPGVFRASNDIPRGRHSRRYFYVDFYREHLMRHTMTDTQIAFLANSVKDDENRKTLAEIDQSMFECRAAIQQANQVVSKVSGINVMADEVVSKLCAVAEQQ